MKTFDEKMKDFAKLAIKVGINIEKGQNLRISSPIETAEFARLLAKEAYEAGAHDVHIDYSDGQFGRLRLMSAPEEALESFPKWKIDAAKEAIDSNTAFLSISSSDPELMSGVDQGRIGKWSKTAMTAMQPTMSQVMAGKVSWNVISVPSKAWAQKVFPNTSGDDAMEKLWDAIFNVVRADQDNPVLAWENHLKTLHEKRDLLNQKRYTRLKFKSSTADLTMALSKKHNWQGGAKKDAKGSEFVANMPTEEVHTMPVYDSVNGTVTSTKPLDCRGTLIDEFTLTFKDGAVVDYSASNGEEALKALLDTDDGAKRIGEVALVPVDSPISNKNITFYNTLFDENASCHLALGRAYAKSLIDGASMSTEDQVKYGANQSLVHVDFMIGSADLTVTGVKDDGSEEKIFTNGNWSI